MGQTDSHQALGMILLSVVSRFLLLCDGSGALTQVPSFAGKHSPTKLFPKPIVQCT